MTSSSFHAFGFISYLTHGTSSFRKRGMNIDSEINIKFKKLYKYRILPPPPPPSPTYSYLSKTNPAELNKVY